MNQPRIEPLPMTELRAEWAATLARVPGAGMKGAASPKNVLGTLMHAPATLGAFLEYWVTSKHALAFSSREQEIVILRMGVQYASEYVWRQHVPVAQEFGLTDAEIEGVRTGRLDALASDRERALVALTDELVQRRSIGDEAWSRWATVLSTTEVLDLIALVAQYVLFALTNNAFRVALEAPMHGTRGLDEPLGG